MNSEEWDYWKVQGCRCDGGFTAEDCSAQICPKGDDPLTVPPSYNGDTWAIAITTAITGENYFYLEIDDLYGTTFRSRTFSYGTADVANAGALTALTTKFGYLLYDIPAIQSVTLIPTTNAAGVLTFSFTLQTPARIAALRFMPNLCVDGCYPYVPASASSQVATPVVSVAASALVESAECSNRGLCDPTVGQCNCFTGHYGLACEHQTVLV